MASEKEEQEERYPIDISKFTLATKLPLNQISVKDLMDILKEAFPDFSEQLESFFSGKYLEWISTKIIEEEDVMLMYRYIKNLAILFEVSFSEEDALLLREIERDLRRLKKHYTIEKVLETHQEGSGDYENEKDLIEEIADGLGEIFFHIENKIILRNEAIAHLRLIQESKKGILEAIANAGGQLNTGGNSNEIQDYQQELEAEENDTIEFIKSSSFQPSTNVFLRNQQKREKEGFEQK